MLSGMEIIAVDPGTEIECDGEKLTVTETQAVTKGRKMYMTPEHVAALKAHPDVVNKTEASHE